MKKNKFNFKCNGIKTKNKGISIEYPFVMTKSKPIKENINIPKNKIGVLKTLIF